MSCRQNAHAIGKDLRLVTYTEQAIDQTLGPVVWLKSALIRDRCTTLTLEFERDYRVRFRAYDDPVAHRFETALPGEVNRQGQGARRSREYPLRRRCQGILSRR